MKEIVSASAGELKFKIKPTVFLSGFILFVVGIAMLIYAGQTDQLHGMLYILMILGGLTATTFGVIEMFGKSRKIVYGATGSAIKPFSLFFEENAVPSIVNMAANNNFDGIERLKKGTKAGCRLDVYLSDDAKFLACQVFAYVPYSYEQVTDLLIQDKSSVERSSKILSSMPQPTVK